MARRQEAIAHIRKYLPLDADAQMEDLKSVAGLLVFTQDTWAEKYRVGIPLFSIGAVH